MNTRTQKGNIAFLVSITIAAQSLFFAPVVHAIEAVTCGGTPQAFNETLFIDTDDAEGNGIEWGTLAECGMTTNYTGGEGDALCVKASAFGPAFDTTFETNEFSLVGVDSASVEFKVNYQDFGGGDRLEVQVSANGVPWTTIGLANISVGLFEGAGLTVNLSLAPVLGADDAKVRWRYYDNTAGADSGVYAQIDDITINCVGGADVSASVTPSAPTVTEGDEVTFNVVVKNDGPKSATDTQGFFSLPAGFTLVDIQSSQGLVIAETDGFGGLIGNIASGNEMTITAVARAGIAPEVALEVLAPNILTGIYDAGGATFGARLLPGAPVTGLVVLADDGVGDTSDGCQEIVNADAMQGNIALLTSGGCSTDVRVKNAQDAGAIGAIVASESIPFPIPPFTDFFDELSTMTPSGTVTEPITIPAIKVRKITGDALKANVVNSLQVSLNGLDFLSQEQKGFGFVRADQADPGFALLQLTDSNNFVEPSIIVVRDRDQDGEPDTTDQCITDASKIAPGVCGCGVSDSDSNSNGIIDCLSGEELKASIAEARSNVQKLRKKKGQKALRKLIRSLLQEIVQGVVSPTSPLLSATSQSNLEKFAKRANRLGKKATRTSAKNFNANKRKARKALDKLAQAI